MAVWMIVAALKPADFNTNKTLELLNKELNFSHFGN